jgi:RNA polymerase sigma-70 factor (ECF subfamily)
MDGMQPPSEMVAGVADEAVLIPLNFEELFAAHHEKLFRALYLIVGSSHEAEELMQDAFISVLERCERIENPVGYLYRTALNATRSRFRRLSMAAKRTITPGEPEDPFAAADLRDELVRALKDLPERQRTALVLVDLLGYTSEDASKILGVTPATVRSLASHARVAMKVQMEPDDG